MAKTETTQMGFFEKVGLTFSLWKESWEAFRLNVWAFLGLYIAPYIILGLLMALYVVPTIMSEDRTTIVITTSSIVALIIMSVALLLYALLTPALTVTQLASAKMQKITFIDALKKGLSRLIPYVLALLLSGLVIALPLPIAILGLAVSPGLGALLLFPALIWAIATGFFLLMVPFIVIADNASPVVALKTSYALTKKYWQWVLAVVVVMLLTSLVSSFPKIGDVLGVVVGILYLCMPAIVYTRYISNK